MIIYIVDRQKTNHLTGKVHFLDSTEFVPLPLNEKD